MKNILIKYSIVAFIFILLISVVFIMTSPYRLQRVKLWFQPKAEITKNNSNTQHSNH